MPDDQPLTYQTPAGALRGDPPQIGGIRDAVLMRYGVVYPVVVLKEEGDEVLVSGATFFGWVWKDELIEEG
jgi:hypothetical protein